MFKFFTKIRKIVIVLILGLMLFTPVLSFAAIAFDAASSANNSGSATLTYTKTVTGSNTILFVTVFDTSGDNTTGVTYNSASMSLVNKFNDGSEEGYLFVLAGASTGSNNVVVSRSTSSGAIYSMASSYTGANQTGQPDNSTTGTFTTSLSVTTTLTTVADNAWSVLFLFAPGGGVSAGTNSTERKNNGTNSLYLYDNNSAITPPQSYGMTQNISLGSAWTLMASFAPVSVAPTAVPYFGDVILFGDW